MAVVKADAYGHGIEKTAKTLENLNVKFLGVATVEEGIYLRMKGIRSRILILGSIFPFDNFKEVIRYGLTPTIASIGGIKALSEYAERYGASIPFHLKVDTGMARIGVSPATAAYLFKTLNTYKNIYLEGIYTHLADGEKKDEFTESQFVKFDRVAKKTTASYIHISASVSILKHKRRCYNLVRPGLLIYGLLPFENADKILDIKPVMSVKTRIVFLKSVGKDTSVSYGRTYFTKKTSKIATIPIGYADGFSRRNSNNGEVLVSGMRVPVVGRVCMDMCMIDVSGLKKVAVGDEAVIIGSQGMAKITAEDVARRCGTINYEVVTSVSKRVPRIYL